MWPDPDGVYVVEGGPGSHETVVAWPAVRAAAGVGPEDG